MKSNKSSELNIVVDSYNSIENAMMQKLLSEGKTFPIEGMVTTIELFPQLLEAIKNNYEVDVNTFANSSSNQLTIIEEVNGLFTANIRNGFQKFMLADIYSISVSEGKKLFDLFKEYEDMYSALNVKIVSFSIGQGGHLEKSHITKNQEDFKTLSKKYYPFLDTDEMFKQYLISNDNLLLLAGTSGTGKTKIVDMLLDFTIKNENLLKFNEDDEDEDKVITVAYVKNPQILAMDMFWNMLQKDNFNFVVLDDMDNVLIDRNINSESHSDEVRLRFISNFLSYTDGIFNTDTKFIVTTNTGISNIDPAILRKGRCFDVLSFRALTNKEALEIWLEAELTEDMFREKFSINENINAADLGANIEFERNLVSKHTTVKDSYILEEGISLYKKNLNKKVVI